MSTLAIFPDEVSRSAVTDLTYATDVSVNDDGGEQRISRWDQPFRTLTFPREMSTAQYSALVSFFRAMRGRLTVFAVRDWSDFSSLALHDSEEPVVSATDQIIGYGDGATTLFQLQKAWPLLGGAASAITRPREGTVLLAVDGVEAEGSVNYDTGGVTLSPAPADGAVITAGFLYDIPARFDIDTLPLKLDQWERGAAEIRIVEIREDCDCGGQILVAAQLDDDPESNRSPASISFSEDGLTATGGDDSGVLTSTAAIFLRSPSRRKTRARLANTISR